MRQRFIEAQERKYVRRYLQVPFLWYNRTNWSHFVCVLVHGRVSSVFVAADCRAFTIYMNGTLQFMSQYEGTLGWLVWFGRSLIPY